MTRVPPGESLLHESPLVPLPPRHRMPLKGVTAIVLCVAIAVVGTSTAVRQARDPEGPPSHWPVLVVADPMVAGVLVRHRRLPKARPRAAAHRVPFSRARDGVPVPVELTAYCLRGTTRRGRWVRPGIVATDPRVFPLSRFVEIFVGDSYLGRFLVDDTGRLIKDNKIDVWLPTCREAKLFGRVQGTAVLVPR